jgi:hypothetical protein
MMSLCGSANLLSTRMPWTRKFAEPLALKDGRTLVTLADARALIQALPQRDQRNERWLYAGGLLLEAATTSGPIRNTVVQLTRALQAEGLI